MINTAAENNDDHGTGEQLTVENTKLLELSDLPLEMLVHVVSFVEPLFWPPTRLSCRSFALALRSFLIIHPFPPSHTLVAHHDNSFLIETGTTVREADDALMYEPSPLPARYAQRRPFCYPWISSHPYVSFKPRMKCCHWSLEPPSDYCHRLARIGCLSLLRWAHEELGHAVSSTTTAFAASGGHLEVVRWLVQQHHHSSSLETGTLEDGQHEDENADSSGITHENENENGERQKKLMRRRKKRMMDERACASAAGNGHLDMVKWLRRQGCPWDEFTCIEAAFAGHLHVLQWALSPTFFSTSSALSPDVSAHTRGDETDVDDYKKRVLEEAPCPLEEKVVFAVAGEGGHEHIIRWLISQGYTPGASLCCGAALGGHKELYQWALQQGYEDIAVRAFCQLAALTAGHLDLLKWFNSTYPDENIRCTARELSYWPASWGHDHIIRWLYAPEAPVGPSFGVFKHCIFRAQLSSLKWVLDHKSIENFDSFTIHLTALKGFLDNLHFLMIHNYYKPHDQLELVYSHRPRSKLPGLAPSRLWMISSSECDIVDLAKTKNSQDSIRHIFEYYRPVAYILELATNAMAFFGNLEMLKWVKTYITHEAGDEDLLTDGMSSLACALAVYGGHFAVVKWLRKNRWPWDERVLEAAAVTCQLKVLKWARARGCAWGGARTGLMGARGGSLKVVQWLVENGCPWSRKQMVAEALTQGHLEVAAWLECAAND